MNRGLRLKTGEKGRREVRTGKVCSEEEEDDDDEDDDDERG